MFYGSTELVELCADSHENRTCTKFSLKKILGDVSYFDALRKNMFLILRISYLYINSKKKEDFTPVSYLDILHLC